MNNTNSSFRDIVLVINTMYPFQGECKQYTVLVQKQCEQDKVFAQGQCKKDNGLIQGPCEQDNVLFHGQSQQHTVLVQKQCEQDKVFAQGHCRQENGLFHGPCEHDHLVVYWQFEQDNVQVQERVTNTVQVSTIAKRQGCKTKDAFVLGSYPENVPFFKTIGLKSTLICTGKLCLFVVRTYFF